MRLTKKRFLDLMIILILFWTNQNLSAMESIVNTEDVSNNIFVLENGLEKEVVDILSKHFKTQIQIESVERLSDLEKRNLILRIKTKNSDLVPKSLIFKQTLSNIPFEEDPVALSRFFQEYCGFKFLNSLSLTGHYVPQFYGASIKDHFVLIEDLGEKHISLVNSLTGDNTTEAISALERFVKCLGKLHCDSYGNTTKYLSTLQDININAKSWQENMDKTLEKLFFKLNILLKLIEIDQTENLFLEIETVIKSVLSPGSFTAFTHGDICPDNVFDNPEKNAMYIIDFEFCSVRSALLDGTYLRMSMPTCWCAKSIPEEVVERLEVMYREELTKKIPAAKNDEDYQTAYIHACAFWVLGTVLYIENLMDTDKQWKSPLVSEKSLWNPDTNMMRPRVLSRLQSFIKVSKKYDKLFYIRSMVEQMLESLRVRWPDAKPMDVYPAFSSF